MQFFFSSHVVFGDVAPVVVRCRLLAHIVVCRIGISRGCLALEVGTVPGGELVLAGLTKRACNVALRVVGPHLANVKILNEHDWVTAPELLRRNQTTRGNNAARGELSTFLDASSLKNDALVTDVGIVINVARVESAAGADCDVVADETVSGHACRQGSCSVDHTVIADRAEVTDPDKETKG